MKLLLDSYLRFNEGYGYAATQLALALNSLSNVDLYLSQNTHHITSGIPTSLIPRLISTTNEKNDLISLIFRTPPHKPEFRWPSKLAWYTSWETTRIPSEWPSFLNKHCHILLVPSRRQLEFFRAGGIAIPIEVIPHGVNQEDFHFIHRPKRETFVFGFYATRLDYRKGVDLLVKAFTNEFPMYKYHDVFLHLKGVGPFNWPFDNEMPFDDRIIITEQITTINEMHDFLHDIDCFVFPTRGEGFGLPPLEAMATGLPVIATNWSGPEDFMLPNHSYPLEYRLVKADIPCRNPDYRYNGFWAEPNIDHLQALMRECYENRTDASVKGDKAAEYVRQSWSWQRPAMLIVDIIEKVFSGNTFSNYDIETGKNRDEPFKNR